MGYLKNICSDAPSDIIDDIIQIVLDTPPANNPRIYEEIVDLALQLDGDRSGKLMPKVLEYTQLKSQFIRSKIPQILKYWAAEDQTEAALELASVLVQFVPDPETEEKQKQRREIQRSQADPLLKQSKLTETGLSPVPRFRDYRRILNEGVRALAEKEPFRVAQILIDATSTMIRLGKHRNESESYKNSDNSKLWCPRLNRPRRERPDYNESLVHALTCACEKVHELESGSIEALDDSLRNQRWEVFRRLRQHLYALHPNEQTLPWIRELILSHVDIGKTEHHYEFQQMTRTACESLGAELLSLEQRTQVFEAILSGPRMEIYRNQMGEQVTDEGIERRRRYFHRAQLRMFAPILFGKYSEYLRELEADESANEISDEDYLPYRESEFGWVTSRSPRSCEELANLSDDELLEYVNEWQDEYSDSDDYLTEFTIERLAEAFQEVFKDFIIPNETRLNFWIENRDNIRRPIYVRAMINAMQDLVKAKNHDKLYKWLPFCEWVLSHSDPQDEHPYGIAQLWDRSSETPRWHTARRAVCDFIETCLERDSEVPISNREHLVCLLGILCTQYDWLLDQKVQTPVNGDDRLIEAIDTTRGRALENLVKMGLWARRSDDNTEITEVKAILAKRFRSGSDCPLKPTEYATLGRLYKTIFDLDSQWAATSKSLVFPQHDFPAWLQAFASFLRYSRPEKRIFDRIRDEYQFALDNLGRLELRDPLEEELKDILGQHLFKCYIRGVLPLEGTNSMMDRFYKATDDDRNHWATLFNHIGHLLRNTSNRLEIGLKERIFAFFEWRLEAGEPLEFREFGEWLEAECLDAEWRLTAFHKVLQIDDILHETVTPRDDNGDSSATWLPMDATQALRSMLPKDTSRVVGCFAKLTDVAPRSSVVYIANDDARAILKAGFDHENESVRKDAERARENLLRNGLFGILD